MWLLQGLARLGGGLRRLRISTVDDFFEAEHVEAAAFVRQSAEALARSLG